MAAPAVVARVEVAVARVVMVVRTSDQVVVDQTLVGLVATWEAMIPGVVTAGKCKVEAAAAGVIIVEVLHGAIKGG